MTDPKTTEHLGKDIIMKIKRILSAMLAAQCLTLCSICVSAEEKTIIPSTDTNDTITVSADSMINMGTRFVTTSADNIFDVITKPVTTSADDIFDVIIPEPDDDITPAPDIPAPMPDMDIKPENKPSAPPSIITPPPIIRPVINTPQIDVKNEDRIALTPEVIARVEEHGDLNGDNTLDISDAFWLLRCIMDGIEIDPAIADFNDDGYVDALDAAIILRYLTKIAN